LKKELSCLEQRGKDGQIKKGSHKERNRKTSEGGGVFGIKMRRKRKKEGEKKGGKPRKGHFIKLQKGKS